LHALSLAVHYSPPLAIGARQKLLPKFATRVCRNPHPVIAIEVCPKFATESRQPFFAVVGHHWLLSVVVNFLYELNTKQYFHPNYFFSEKFISLKNFCQNKRSHNPVCFGTLIFSSNNRQTKMFTKVKSCHNFN
jgi:hypothetical protein